MGKDSITALGMIGAWAEHEEKFLLDKIVTARNGVVTMTVKEAETFVEALNRLQEGIVAVLHEEA